MSIHNVICSKIVALGKLPNTIQHVSSLFCPETEKRMISEYYNSDTLHEDLFSVQLVFDTRFSTVSKRNVASCFVNTRAELMTWTQKNRLWETDFEVIFVSVYSDRINRA